MLRISVDNFARNWAKNTADLSNWVHNDNDGKVFEMQTLYEYHKGASALNNAERDEHNRMMNRIGLGKFM